MWNSVSVPRTVTIKDQKIVCLYNIVLIGLIAYVAIWLCAKAGIHLAAEPASLSVQTTVQFPLVQRGDQWVTDYSDPMTLDYCNSGSYKCKYMTGPEMETTESNEVFISSMMIVDLERRNTNCTLEHVEECGLLWKRESSIKYLVVDAEKADLWFIFDLFTSARSFASHAMTGMLHVPTTDCTGITDAGYLSQCEQAKENRDAVCKRTDAAIFPEHYPADEGKPTDTAPCYLPGKQDSRHWTGHPILDLMHAAGVDPEMDADPQKPGKLIRHAGKEIIITVEYTNWEPFGRIHSIPKFVLKPLFLNAKEARIRELSTNSRNNVESPDTQYVVTKYGIRFVFAGQGKLYHRSFAKEVVTFGASLSLFGLARAMVSRLTTKGLCPFIGTPILGEEVAGTIQHRLGPSLSTVEGVELAEVDRYEFPEVA